MLTAYTPSDSDTFNHAPKNAYARQIDAAAKNGPEALSKLPGILWVFAAMGAGAAPLAQYTQEVMRGPGTLSELIRELIAVVVSATNNAEFCAQTHAATAMVIAHDVGFASGLSKIEHQRLVAEVLGSVAVIVASHGDQIGPHLQGSKLESLLAFCALLTHKSELMTAENLEKMYAELANQGWDASAVSDAVRVCALFNMYNRLILGFGVQPMDIDATAASGLLLGRHGYLPLENRADDPEYVGKVQTYIASNTEAVSKDFGWALEAAAKYVERNAGGAETGCSDPSCKLHGAEGVGEADADPDQEIMAALRAAGIIGPDESLDDALKRLDNTPAELDGSEVGDGDESETCCHGEGCELSKAVAEIGKAAEALKTLGKGSSEIAEVSPASPAPVCEKGSEGGCGGKPLAVSLEGGCGGHKSEGGCGGHKE